VLRNGAEPSDRLNGARANRASLEIEVELEAAAERAHSER
jgi:hypothetical protein